MERLTVLYDARCNLCRRVKSWLAAEPTYVDLVFIPAGSEEAQHRFPQLDHGMTLNDLTVVSDGGAVYREANAWVMCLWALRNYRAWSLRLSSPELMPFARRIVVWIAQNRFRLGRSHNLPKELLYDLKAGDKSDAIDIECGDSCRI